MDFLHLILNDKSSLIVYLISLVGVDLLSTLVAKSVIPANGITTGFISLLNFLVKNLGNFKK